MDFKAHKALFSIFCDYKQELLGKSFCQTFFEGQPTFVLPHTTKKPFAFLGNPCLVIFQISSSTIYLSFASHSCPSKYFSQPLACKISFCFIQLNFPKLVKFVCDMSFRIDTFRNL